MTEQVKQEELVNQPTPVEVVEQAELTPEQQEQVEQSKEDLINAASCRGVTEELYDEVKANLDEEGNLKESYNVDFISELLLEDLVYGYAERGQQIPSEFVTENIKDDEQFAKTIVPILTQNGFRIQMRTLVGADAGYTYFSEITTGSRYHNTAIEINTGNLRIHALTCLVTMVTGRLPNTALQLDRLERIAKVVKANETFADFEAFIEKFFPAEEPETEEVEKAE